MTEAAFTSTPLSAQVQGAVRSSASDRPQGVARAKGRVNRDRRERLASRACAGDQAALFEFFVLVRPSLEAFLVTRRAPLQDLDDLLHDACLVAMRGQSRLRPASARELQSWLCTIAHNVLRRVRRTSEREERRRMVKWWTFDSDYRDGIAGPDGEPEEVVVPDWLVEGLDSLSDLQRDAICMKFFRKMDSVEIAKRLEITPATARKRISLAYAALRRCYMARQEDVPADRE